MSPLSRADVDVYGQPTARAIVFIINPDHVSETDIVLIRRSYGLSRAETDVALVLLQDKTVQEISDLLSISINTVRFHLKHIHSKTGTRRQSELVRLLEKTSQIRRTIARSPGH